MSAPINRTPMPVLRTREKVIYEQCWQLLRLTGWVVYRLSQPRASHQTLGLPDLYAIHPDHGVLWVECKTDIGKQSPAQHDFQLTHLNSGVASICGGAPELQHYLTTGQILRWPRSLQEHPEKSNLAAHGQLLDRAIAEWNRTHTKHSHTEVSRVLAPVSVAGLDD
jgi:hypothetical protein